MCMITFFFFHVVVQRMFVVQYYYIKRQKSYYNVYIYICKINKIKESSFPHPYPIAFTHTFISIDTCSVVLYKLVRRFTPCPNSYLGYTKVLRIGTDTS